MIRISYNIRDPNTSLFLEILVFSGSVFKWEVFLITHLLLCILFFQNSIYKKFSNDFLGKVKTSLDL